MIPAELLQPRVTETLVRYLTDALRRVQSERAGLEQDWIRYATAYRARPKEEVKMFPFPNAANLTIPVMATDVDTLVAQILGLLASPPNLWSCRATRPDMIDFAARTQEFLQWAQDAELHMPEVLAEFVTECALLGTGILKQRYTREEQTVFEWREMSVNPQEIAAQFDSNGMQLPSGPQVFQQTVRRVLKDRPEVSRVSLADFYIPAGFADIQKAPWVAERLTLTWNQLENRARSGLYVGLDRMATWWNQRTRASRGAMFQNAMEQLDNFIPSQADTFEVYEFWLNYTLDPAKGPQALVCTIHVDSGTYLRIDYNPFFNQEKPYSVARMLRVPGRFYGIGLGEMLFQFQEEITTMHNQRIDNATLSNTKAWVARKGAGIKQNEALWPGLIKLMDDPDAIKPLAMGDRYDSTIQNEAYTLNYARSRSGVNDYVAGGAGEASVGYSTATTVVEMLKQGRKRFDQFLREINWALSETGTRVLELYQQFNQGGKPYLVLGDEDGATFSAVLQFPLDIVRSGILVRVAATSGHLNKETEIRTNQLLFGMAMNFYQQLFQGLSIAINPQLPPQLRIAAAAMIEGGTTLMRRIFDNYDVQDVERIIPRLEGLAGGLEQQIAAQWGPGAGGGQLAQGPNAAPSMAFGGGGGGGAYGAGVPPTPQFQRAA